MEMENQNGDEQGEEQEDDHAQDDGDRLEPAHHFTMIFLASAMPTL